MKFGLCKQTAQRNTCETNSHLFQLQAMNIKNCIIYVLRNFIASRKHTKTTLYTLSFKSYVHDKYEFIAQWESPAWQEALGLTNH